LQSHDCWRYLAFILLSSPAKKDRDKIRSEILLWASPSSPLSKRPFTYTLEIGFPGPTPAMLLVFLKSVTNALVLYFFSESRVSDY